jgi:hypothetical protein
MTSAVLAGTKLKYSGRRRRKEAEELKRAEEKAERENYAAWVEV